MNRRSNEVVGFVNFPVTDPRYKNSGEGGMFVRLVVDTGDNEWHVCCGGDQVLIYDENLIGDDVHLQPTDQDIFSQVFPSEEFFFPGMKEEGSDSSKYNYSKYMSVGMPCIITIGSTGWSGWNEETHQYFLCRYENLTPEGQALYNLIEKLYEGKGKIYLQTWLDT